MAKAAGSSTDPGAALRQDLFIRMQLRRRANEEQQQLQSSAQHSRANMWAQIVARQGLPGDHASQHMPGEMPEEPPGRHLTMALVEQQAAAHVLRASSAGLGAKHKRPRYNNARRGARARPKPWPVEAVQRESKVRMRRLISASSCACSRQYVLEPVRPNRRRPHQVDQGLEQPAEESSRCNHHEGCWARPDGSHGQADEPAMIQETPHAEQVPSAQ